eukprot:243506_1
MATGETRADADTLELKQFNEPVDQKWVNMAHKDMASRWWRWMSFDFKKTRSAHSPFWICGFCRSYVKQSNVSIMTLGQALNLSSIEMNIVRKLRPVLCPHCYRVRLDYSRFQLVSEIISYWIFCFVVGPVLVILFGFLVCLSSPCKTKLKIYDSEEQDKNCKDYLNGQSEEDRLFDEATDLDEPINVWQYLDETRESIDPVQLRNKINAHMIEITADVPITELAFREQFLGIHSLITYHNT